MHIHRNASQRSLTPSGTNQPRHTKTHPTLMFHYRCLLVENGRWWWGECRNWAPFATKCTTHATCQRKCHITPQSAAFCPGSIVPSDSRFSEGTRVIAPDAFEVGHPHLRSTGSFVLALFAPLNLKGNGGGILGHNFEDKNRESDEWQTISMLVGRIQLTWHQPGPREYQVPRQTTLYVPLPV
jgi:hypothetical protein